MKKNKIWFNWHREITAQRPLAVDDVYNDEKSNNIDYLKMI